MATIIQQAFIQLRSNLEITGLQTEVVSTRQSGVRDVLASGLTVLDTFLTGSYSRSTMIAPLADADIDVFAVLDVAYFHRYNGANGGPRALLDLARRTLLKTYTRTPDISRNGQAVTVRFSDFVIDVVLGFHRNGGGYLIANSVDNSWLSTDPKAHVSIVSAANASHETRLVPLIKMIKGWNKSQGSFFRSFHLEVLALAIFANVRITDFPSGLRFFFEHARTAVRMTAPDPAGYGDNVGRYITAGKMGEAIRRLDHAYQIAVAAEAAGNRGNNRTAIESWGMILPGYFPAYG